MSSGDTDEFRGHYTKLIASYLRDRLWQWDYGNSLPDTQIRLRELSARFGAIGPRHLDRAYAVNGLNQLT